MRITIRDRYDCAPETFWERYFFADDYNQALYREGLSFERFEVVEDRALDSGGRHRRIRVMPKLDAPAPVKKLIGDALTYDEEGDWGADGHWRSRIVPSRLADKVKIESHFWLEPDGADACQRIVEIDLEVRIPGLRKIFERFVEGTIRQSYVDTTRFTNRWLSEHPPA